MMGRAYLIFCLLFCAVRASLNDDRDAYYFYTLGRNAQYQRNDLEAALQYYSYADSLVASGESSLNVELYLDMLNDFAVLSLPHDTSSAKSIFRRILSVAPTHLSALVNLASLVDSTTAEVYYQQALAAHPTSGPLHYNYGVFRYGLQDKISAERHWQLAIQNNNGGSSPSLAAANIATLHCQNNNMTSARNYYELAIGSATNEDYYSILFQQYTSVLPILLTSTQHIQEVRTAYLTNLVYLALYLPQASIPNPDDHIGCSSLGYYAIYHGYNDIALRRLYSSVIRIAAPDYVEGRDATSNEVASSSSGKIKVGFLSGFFYHHSVGLLMQGVIANIDRQYFEVVVIIFDDMPTHDHNILSSADKIVVLNENIHNSRDKIRGLGLDILVFSEIGMHSQTYFLAHSCLASTTAVFWGHAVTSGITSDDTSHRCAPNYFISSVLFEASQAAQCKYTERLLLLQPPLSYQELFSGSTSVVEVKDESGEWSVRMLPTKVQFLRYLFRCDSGGDDSSSSSIVCSDELSVHRRLYGVPQTLYKLSPQFVSVIGKVMMADPEGWVVLPAGQDSAIATAALANLASMLGNETLRRIIFVRPMKGREFITLCSIFDVVLDTYPVGGGRSSLEIFSVGTPIVALASATSILQLTAGMYGVMGINCCVADTESEYVTLATAIATTPSLSYNLRSQILKYKSRLYRNSSVIDEWEKMLLYIHTRPHDPHTATATYCEQHRSFYDYDVGSEYNEHNIATKAIESHEALSMDRKDTVLSQFLPTYDMPAVSMSMLGTNEIEWMKLRLLWSGEGKNDIIYEHSFDNVISEGTLHIMIRNIDTIWQEQLYQQLSPVADRLKLYFIAAYTAKEVNKITQPVVKRLPITFHLTDESHEEFIPYEITLRQYDTPSQLLLRLLTDKELQHVPFDAIAQAESFAPLEGCNDVDAVAYRRGQSVRWLHWNNDPSRPNKLLLPPLAPLSIFSTTSTLVSRDNRITFGITTSKRLSHFRRTFLALLPTLRCLRELYLLHQVIVVDDGSTASDRAAMIEEFGDMATFILKSPQERGHANSMNILLQSVTTRYFLYIEDDWLLLDQPLVSSSLAKALSLSTTIATVPLFATLITAARNVLVSTASSSEPIHEVLFNEQSQRECSLGHISNCNSEILDTGGWSRYTKSTRIPYRLHEFALPPIPSSSGNHYFSTWPGFSLNPGLWDLAALRQLCGRMYQFNESDVAFEQRATLELYGAGWTMGYLSAVVLEHIGDVSSYALNNITRPFDDAVL